MNEDMCSQSLKKFYQIKNFKELPQFYQFPNRKQYYFISPYVENQNTVKYARMAKEYYDHFEPDSQIIGDSIC